MAVPDSSADPRGLHESRTEETDARKEAFFFEQSFRARSGCAEKEVSVGVAKTAEFAIQKTRESQRVTGRTRSAHERARATAQD